jgi:hypothetical protein
VLLQSATMTVLKIILIIRGKYLLVINIFRCEILGSANVCNEGTCKRRQFADGAGKKKNEKAYHSAWIQFVSLKSLKKFVVIF